MTCHIRPPIYFEDLLTLTAQELHLFVQREKATNGPTWLKSSRKLQYTQLPVLHILELIDTDYGPMRTALEQYTIITAAQLPQARRIIRSVDEYKAQQAHRQYLRHCRLHHPRNSCRQQVLLHRIHIALSILQIIH